MRIISGFASIQSLSNKNRNGKLSLLAMALPPFALLAVFSYLPLLGWVYAFFEDTSLRREAFVGFKYIKTAVLSPEILNVVVNTLAMSLINIAFGVVPVIFAILISELRSTKYQRVIQTFTTLPNFISWVLVYSLMYALFSSEGMLNALIFRINPESSGLNILGNADFAWLIQCLFYLWKTAGWSAIIYIAAISGIDQMLYEAAIVDGAGRFRKIWHITIPGIAETYIVLLMLGIAGMLSSGFDQFFVFNNSLVASKLNVLDYYVYSVGIRNNIVPMATAIGIYKTLISIILLVLCNTIAKRIRGGTSII